MHIDSTARKPVLLFVAPYFPPACYGGVVQVYLGLLQRLTEYRIVVVSDLHGCAGLKHKEWDAAAPESFGFEMRRLTSFELHLSNDKDGAKHVAPSSLLTPVHRFCETVSFFKHGRREWRLLLQELRPDMVLCGGTYSAGWLMRQLPASIPLVNYIHGEELTMRVRPLALLPLMRFWQMRSLRQATCNIAVSNYTARLIKTLARVDQRNIKLLPNFVDTQRFKISGRRNELRTALGWDRQLILLTLARLEPRKGIDQTLRALAHLNRDRRLPDNWKYIVAGRGVEQQRLTSLCHELGLSGRVEFIGFVADHRVPELYEAADIFLQTNRDIDGDTEGFGIVFLEASACGVPVIGGIAGGTADAIEHGVSGYRVDAKSTTTIEDAVALLASDRDLRERLGRQGSDRVRHGFTIEQAATRFGELLDEVYARRKSLGEVSLTVA